MKQRSSARGGNPWSRWRRQRKTQRESVLLIREARRILRQHRERIKDDLAEELAKGIDAVVELRKSKDYRKLRERAEKLDDLLEKHLAFARKSAIREYVESIGIAVLIAVLLRFFVIEAFKIPSGSMIPTLRIGDHIFVNKFIYGVRIPWTEIRFFTSVPDRGDVVVFVYPNEPDKDFIKRIVAVGGDTIEVRDNLIHVNGQPVRRRPVDGRCSYIDGDEDTEEWQIVTRRCNAYDERLDKNRYRVIQDPERSGLRHYGPTEVPEGHVFVMGDNRDNSHDSRAWENSPFVPMLNIKGKAMFVWWSSEPNAAGCANPKRVRWGRFFSGVHKVPNGSVVEP